MDEVLKILNQEQGVLGSAFVSKEGLVISSILPSNLDSEAMAGVCASAFLNADTASSVLGQGEILLLSLEAENGKTFLAKVQEGFIVVITSSNINLGKLRIEIRRAVESMKKYL